jgi:aminopeptidase N
VRIDPDFTVLAKISFTPPGPMLDKQLESDVIGRILAVRTLDREHIVKLGQILREDKFPTPCVQRGSQSAREDREPEAPGFDRQQRESKTRGDAQSRRAGARQPEHAESRETLWKMAQGEKNPAILATIVETWSARPGEPTVSEALKKHLAASSYQSMPRTGRDQNLACPGRRIRRSRRARTTPGNRTICADAMPAPPSMRSPSSHVVPRIQIAMPCAISSLRNSAIRAATGAWPPRRRSARLRDPKALGLLDLMLAISGRDRIDPVREAAAKSAQDIRAGLESPADLKNLWDRVQQLQKKSEDQEKEIEALKKKPQTAKK